MPGELNEKQIRQTAIILGLPADFIRKDYFITKAIRLLVAVPNDYSVLKRVLAKEQEMFDADSSELEIKTSDTLHHLRADKKWQEHWKFFLEQMVYQKDKPNFEQAVMVVAELNNQLSPDIYL